MKINTQEEVEKFLAKPTVVGDVVYVRGLGSQNKQAMSNSTKVVDVNDDGSIVIEEYGSRKTIQKEDFKKKTTNIGYNPFPKKQWDSDLKPAMFNLESIMHSCGFEARKKEYTFNIFEKIEVPEINWNPTFSDKNGNDILYQRDFCWSLKDKQLLIESIYNNLDVGKIILRKRSFDWVKNRAINGKSTAFKDIVDGKQRIGAILEFVEDKFKDFSGYVFSELSENAKANFLNFMSISYAEIGENASDEDVKSIFVNLNFCGVQMSQEHLDYVKNIKL